MTRSPLSSRPIPVLPASSPSQVRHHPFTLVLTIPNASSSLSYSYTLSFLFFFFSSRRRHTRYWRDWSSDVCSSDLGGSGSAAGGSAAPEDMRFVNVVKLVGVGWFDRMEVGIDEFAEETGIDATQTGADDASPEKQVKVIQDLIAQRPTAITVVPNSPESLEATLKIGRASCRERV